MGALKGKLYSGGHRLSAGILEKAGSGKGPGFPGYGVDINGCAEYVLDGSA